MGRRTGGNRSRVRQVFGKCFGILLVLLFVLLRVRPSYRPAILVVISFWHHVVENCQSCSYVLSGMFQVIEYVAYPWLLRKLTGRVHRVD